jgi:hypothetical protein
MKILPNNELQSQIQQLKSTTFGILLKNMDNTPFKNKYFDNTFSFSIFKEMLFSELLDKTLQKVNIGFEDKLYKEFSNEQKRYA